MSIEQRIQILREKVQDCVGNAAVSVSAVAPFMAASEALDIIQELQAALARCFEDEEIALASHRKDVIEECAKVCDNYAAARPMKPLKIVLAAQQCAAAIRALLEPPKPMDPELARIMALGDRRRGDA